MQHRAVHRLELRVDGVQAPAHLVRVLVGMLGGPAQQPAVVVAHEQRDGDQPLRGDSE